VLEPDRAARFLDDGRSPLLCALPPGAAGPRAEGSAVLAPGARLLLYSDGLVERRRESLDVGLARLAERAAAAGAGPGWSDELVRTMLAGAGDDDVALLTATYAPVFQVRMPAMPERLAGLRRELRSWLAAVGVSGDDAADVLLAIGEAAANAVEHAFAAAAAAASLGELVVELRLGAGRELTVRVVDTGRWRKVPAPGDRGRGLPMMRAVMESIEVESGEGGTVVTMRHHLAEPS
jgi:anti-sigma regulatory factor (Ser/Thr protein kinase)